MPTADALAALYNRDFHAWCLRTAELLADGSLEALDIDHLREEVEGLAWRDEREVARRIKRIQRHLLKLEFKSGVRTKSDLGNERDELASLFEQRPSLLVVAERNTAKAYRLARRLAIIEMDLPPSAFPEECPYTFDQILDQDFVPAK